jgi:hypothetical protein
MYQGEVKLRFRCDAFNAFNHSNFNPPDADITESGGTPFGTISKHFYPRTPIYRLASCSFRCGWNS